MQLELFSEVKPQPIAITGNVTARDYQIDIQNGFFEKWEEHRSVLSVAATGLGKTVIAGITASRWREVCKSFGLPEKILFLVHRQEIVYQAARAFKNIIPDVRVDIEMSAEQGSKHADVVCASVQSLSSDWRLNRWLKEHFGLIIVDEAHHWVKKNKQYQNIVSHFHLAKVMGLTATPDRSDERALGQSFDAAIDTIYDYAWGVENGWLVPIVSRMFVIEDMDWDVIYKDPANDMRDGDGSKLSEMMSNEKVIQAIVSETTKWATHVNDFNPPGGIRPTLIFASSCQNSDLMAEVFNRHHAHFGTGKAFSVTSKKSEVEIDRKEILERFAAGDINYLINYGVYTEGTDLPGVRLIVPSRLTKSRQLFGQMIGRGGRPDAGIADLLSRTVSPQERKNIIRTSCKPSVMVLDPCGVTDRHSMKLKKKAKGVCSSFDVLAGRYDDDLDLQGLKDSLKKKPGVIDVNLELQRLREERKNREQSKRMFLIGRPKVSYTPTDVFSTIDVNPGYEPGWSKGKVPTPKMRGWLKYNGLNWDEIDRMSFHEASKIIAELRKRADKGLCNWVQSKILLKMGIDPKEVTHAEAERIIRDKKR